MNTETLIQLLINNLSTLQNRKNQYLAAGDINNFTAIDTEIADTEATIANLRRG
jgi:hypothetical protein